MRSPNIQSIAFSLCLVALVGCGEEKSEFPSPEKVVPVSHVPSPVVEKKEPSKRPVHSISWDEIGKAESKVRELNKRIEAVEKVRLVGGAHYARLQAVVAHKRRLREVWNMLENIEVTDAELDNVDLKEHEKHILDSLPEIEQEIVKTEKYVTGIDPSY